MKLMRKRGANTVKSAIALAFCLLLILPFPAPAAAFAAETGELPDPDRTGSFTATFKYYDESTGKTLPVAGGNSVGLYKVADVVVDHGYQFVVDERFAAAGEIPATDEALDGANADLAAKMAAIASGLEFDESPQEMDAEGTVRFDGLSVGLYLVMQAKKGTGSDEFTIEPFLVSIPRRNPDGTLLYDVTGESKPINVAWNPPREPDQPDKPKKPSKLPQTGQLWWPVMALGAAGALFVLAGAAAKRRK